MSVTTPNRLTTFVAQPAPGGLRKLVFKALGTHCEVQYVCPPGVSAAELEKRVVGWVASFESRYSRFQPRSALSLINASAGGDFVAVDREMAQLLDLCGQLHRLSDGLMDPTILPLLRLWDYRGPNPRPPSEAQLEAGRALVGWERVERKAGAIRLPVQGMCLDFGGFGKEWAVDMVAAMLSKEGVQAALVDFGHDIRALGAPPGRPAWHIGIEDPARPGTSACSVALFPGQAIAGSGDYLRYFMYEGRRYSHILDPRTGRPIANGSIQSTVIAGSCLLAGLLSTCSLIRGMEEGLRLIQAFQGAEGLIVGHGQRAQTRGFWRHVV